METKRQPRPAPLVCPLCSRDKPVIEVIGPMLWRYTCNNKRHSGGSFSWQGTTVDRVDEPAAEGIAAELGLYDDLPRCLNSGDPFVEYGIVEHRYSELRPDIYQQLIDRYSHTLIQPKHYTVSVFIALALGWLAKHGEVLYRFGPATGYWSYNGGLSYWALPPGPSAEAPMLSWEQFALENALDLAMRDWKPPRARG